MGLIKKSSAPIPPGEMLRFKVGDGEITEGNHGPQAWIGLEVISPGQYKGVTFPTWSKLVKDEKTGKLIFSDRGRLFNTAVACFHGDVTTIDSFPTVEKLLKAMKGKTLKSITKAKGEEGKYIDITWDMQYPDTEGSKKNSKKGPKNPEPLEPQEHEPGEDLPDDGPEAPF